MSANFVYFVLPAILLILGLPIFVVLILTSLAAILLVAHVPTQAIQTYMFGSLDNFPLLAVPFFILAGEIMGRGGIANRVVTWVVSIIGGVRGSLAVTRSHPRNCSALWRTPPSAPWSPLGGSYSRH